MSAKTVVTSQQIKEDREPTFNYQGRTFYRFLVKHSEYNRPHLRASKDYNNNSFVFAISYQVKDKYKSAFTAVNNITDFYEYYDKEIPDSERNYFEVITGTQKPHFDIDVAASSFNSPDEMMAATNHALNVLLLSISHVFKLYNVDYNPTNNLLVFSSSDHTKGSYHVVIDNFYHLDNNEAAAFYHLVVTHMRTLNFNPNVSIDDKVYSKTQQFRLFKSQKLDSNRPKKIVQSLSRPLRDRLVYTKVDDFLSTLVGHVSGCKLLPSFIVKDDKVVKHNTRSLGDIDGDVLMQIIASHPDSRNFRQADSSPNGIMSFNRISPSHCSCHRRSHSSNGAFVSVSNNGYVYWNCLAGNPTKQSVYIGTVNRSPTLIDDVNSFVEEKEDGVFTFGDYVLPQLVTPPQPIQQQSVPAQPTQQSVPAQPTQQSVPAQPTQQRVPAHAIVNGVDTKPVDDKIGIEVEASSTVYGKLFNKDSKLSGEIYAPLTDEEIEKHRNIYYQLQLKLEGINANVVVKPTTLATPSPDGNKDPAATELLYSNNRVAAGNLTIDPLATGNDLLLFITCHVTSSTNGMIPIGEMLKTYKSYCKINNLTCQYTTDDTTNIGKHLTTQAPHLTPVRKQLKGVRTMWIMGYSFVKLGLMKKNTGTNVVTTLAMAPKPIQLNKFEREELQRAERKQQAAEARAKKKREMAAWFEALIRNIRNGTRTRVIKTNPDDPDYTDDKLPLDPSPILKPIEDLVGDREHYLLFLIAACGMGKTEQIMSVIKKSKSFIMITGRILLGRKLYDDCYVEVIKSDGKGHVTTEMVHTATFYSDLKGTLIESEKTIVTIDSTHRICQKYEYLILDEMSYTLTQLVSFSKNKERNSNKLIQMIRSVPKVIVADACLAQETIDMVKETRSRGDSIIYENTYPKQQDKQINVLESTGIFYEMIHNSVRKGENIIIPSGGQKIADAIASYMVNKLGCVLYREHETPAEGETRYKVKIYTGEDKKYGNPTAEWHMYNAVIYTSVIEAGNSFTLRHFHKCYGYFTARSFGPQSAMQMLLRCRQLITNQIYILCMEGAPTGFPHTVQTLQDVKDYVRTDNNKMREELFEGITLSYDKGGIDYNTPYYNMFCDVKYREMIGKRNYLDNLLYYCKEQGMRFGQYITNDERLVDTGLNEGLYKEHIKQISGHIKEEKEMNEIIKHDSISKARDIPPEDIESYKNRGGNMSREERYEIIKYDLRERFKKDTIDKEFVGGVINKLREHTNVTMCKSLSGEMDEEEKIRRMKTIAENYSVIERNKITREMCVAKVQMSEEPSLQDLINGELLYRKEMGTGKNKVHMSETLYYTEKMRRYRTNMHAVNMLRLLGFNKWLNITNREFDVTKIKEAEEYLMANGNDFQRYGPGSTNKPGSDVGDIIVQINDLVKVFNIKFDEASISRYWELNDDGIVRPYSQVKKPIVEVENVIPVNKLITIEDKTRYHRPLKPPTTTPNKLITYNLTKNLPNSNSNRTLVT